MSFLKARLIVMCVYVTSYNLAPETSATDFSIHPRCSKYGIAEYSMSYG